MTGGLNPYDRLRRSFETQRLEAVLPAAAEVGWINLSDALSILALMAHEGDPRFDRAAARWSGACWSRRRRSRSTRRVG